MNLNKPKFWDKNQISIFSILLFPLTIIVKILSFLKRNLTKTHRASVPVICVGNIYIGGTGKTPLSVEIFSILKSLNMNPAFIRKEYASFQDEFELQKKVGPVYQNKNRIKAVEKAMHDKINIAILDDGFQDFSINKDLSIICFNEKQGLGNGLTIPSGPLRESLASLKRADCVVINGKKNTEIEAKILEEKNDIKIFYTKYVAQNRSKFANKKVSAFAGIGNPENFFNLLVENNIDVIEKINFPDHYCFSEKELDNLIDVSKKNNTILITTEKDYYRIKKDYQKKIDFLKIKVEIENKEEFIDQLKKTI